MHGPNGMPAGSWVIYQKQPRGMEFTRMTRKSPKTAAVTTKLPPIVIEQSILFIRGQKVLLDTDLAALYGVTTKVLNQAVKRNLARFPADFMLQLTWEEARHSRSRSVTLKRGGNVKYEPYAFTEQGVAMLASVLRSPRAIAVNIEIMRAFVRLRSIIASNKAIARKLRELERRVATHDQTIADLIEAIQRMLNQPEPKRRRIGFVISDD